MAFSNRIWFVTAIALASVVLVTPPASSQRVAQMVGAGGVGCGPYLADRKADRYAQFYSQWVQGYLFGYDYFSTQPKLSKIPDEDTIHAFLEKHCREHPLDYIATATNYLISDLGGWTAPSIKK